MRTSKVPLPLAIWFWQNIRKLVILVLGITILLLGVVMLVFPGPGWVTIFAGLSLLATEFAWARWALRYGKDRLAQLLELAKSMVNPPAATEAAPSTLQNASTSSTTASQPIVDRQEGSRDAPRNGSRPETFRDEEAAKTPLRDVIDTSATVIDERPASPGN